MSGSLNGCISLAQWLHQANSCPPGTDIWVPRTHALLTAVVDYYGNGAKALGIYGQALLVIAHISRPIVHISRRLCHATWYSLVRRMAAAAAHGTR